MASLGIDEVLRTTETGGIFAMEGGQPGGSVVLRGDIDALPVHEDEARAVHSEIEGRMHACGHDIHVASLLGAASVLASRRDELPGRYTFLFQPAEEALCGAKAMLERGALTAMEGARLVGFHVTSQLPTGFIALKDGISMSEANSVHITLSGPGGHGAMPSDQGDVIRATAELVSRLGDVAAGLSYEGTNCVCSAGTIHAGTAINVVPTTARVTGTLRTFTEAQHVEALDRLQALCDSVGDDQGVHVELEVPEHTRAVVNDATGRRGGRGRGRRGRRSRPGLPHAARRAERRRERVLAPPARLLLLRGRRGGGRLERDAPQPHLPRRRRGVAGRRQRARARRPGIGRAVRVAGTMIR